jgi:DNA-binding MarR family transcriptional regulator
VGLTSSRWQVLGAIEEQPLPVAQIARNMGLARQNVQRLADALQKEGIIHYAPNPDHQRAKLAGLTPKGRRAMQDLGELQALWANKVASAVSAAEIRSVLGIVNKLRSRLDSDEVRPAQQRGKRGI